MKVIWFIKCLIGFGSVNDGSICWFSKNFYEVHDYPCKKGGDGSPLHFVTERCSKCGKEFEI